MVNIDELLNPSASAVSKTDTRHLLVLLERDVKDTDFFRYATEYGDGVNYLPSIASAFLRLHTPDTDGRQIQEVRALPGVIWADYNTRTMKPQYVPTDPLASANNAIYDELDLQTAWGVTKGDPRIKIGVTDTGCDLRHPDINAQSGGVFMGGIHISSLGFPIKLDIATMFRQSDFEFMFEYGYEIQVFAYDPERVIPYQQHMPTYVPVPAYAESTCKTALPTSGTALAYGHPNEIWVNQPVDVLISGPLDPEGYQSKSYWHYGIGRFEQYDGYGHGTAATGIIAGKHDTNGLAGIAPECTVLHYKCSSDTAGFIDDLALLPALDKAVSDGCHIISTSLAGESADASVNSAVAAACYNHVLSSGISWFCAASNGGRYPAADVELDLYGWPASWPGVLSIGACGDKAGAQDQVTGYLDDEPQFLDYSRISWFSQKNNKVFAVAPGFGYIVHAPLTHSNMWRIGGAGWSSRHYAYQRTFGTSWACPAAAGVGGLMLSKAIQPYTTSDPAEVWGILNSTCNRDRLKSILASTANTTVKLCIGGTATKGFGAGRIRAGAAVLAV